MRFPLLLLFLSTMVSAAPSDSGPQFQAQLNTPAGVQYDGRDRNWFLNSGTDSMTCTLGGTSITKLWDGTNTAVVKAGNAQPSVSDTALEITERPDNVGTPTQTSVSCGTGSTTLLAAGTATMFLSIRNPTTATTTVWLRLDGAAATTAPPAIDLAPGSEADFFAEGPSFLPTSLITCIGASAQTVAVYYK